MFTKECEAYGKEIDRLRIQKDYEGLREYLKEIEKLLVLNETQEHANIFYYLGTGYGVLADYYRKLEETVTAQSVTENRKWSFCYLRKAMELAEQCEKGNVLLLNIYTNYANGLDACGRVIEAIRIYRKVMELEPKFGMAIGNYGRALKFYGNLVNDLGHYNELHYNAQIALQYALELDDPNLHSEARIVFAKMLKEYEGRDYKTCISMKKSSNGEGEEYRYRRWCLANHLFLNPLNDLFVEEEIFAHDPLTITRYTEFINKDELRDNEQVNPPKWFAMLNQLKEEYIYSRFLCYEGMEKLDEPHWADKGVKISLASFDYVNYSIRLEQIKTAYKNLFAIFDKIGFFINEFWKLDFKEREADAAHVFKSSKYPIENVALLSLYWSYFEFYEKFGDAESASEKDLKTFRNALEHKFVKIHQYSYGKKLQIEDDSFYHISEDELKSNTLHLLELAREWIMMLVYAIEIDERKKKVSGNAVRLEVTDFDDEWKI